MGRRIAAFPTILVLLLLVALLTPGEPRAQAQPAEVGHVIAAAGSFTATQPGGKRRTLTRRSPIFNGDVLVTGDKAQGQVRFSDGSLVSLRPRSEFRVDDFRFDGSADGDENAAFTLIKGGMRTITGVIGKKDRSRYKVSTDVATIGVRGTHYVLQQCAGGDCGSGAGGLYGGVVDGSIVVSNGGGERVVDNDQFFHVAGSNSAPRLLLSPPGALFSGEGQGGEGGGDGNGQEGDAGADGSDGEGEGGTSSRDEAPDEESTDGTGSDGSDGEGGDAGSQTGDGGSSTAGSTGFDALSTTLGTDPNLTPDTNLVSDVLVESAPEYVSAPNGALIGVAFVNREGPDDYDITSDLFYQGEGNAAGTTDVKLGIINGIADAVVIGEVYLQNFEGGTWQPGCSPCTVVATEASLTDTGTRGGINWGRWSEGFVVTADNGVVDEVPGSLHYIYSPNTTPYSTVQSMTGMFTYSLVGGTSPTNETGAVGHLSDARIWVDFSNQTITHAMLSCTFGSTKEFDLGSSTMVPLAQVYEQGTGIELTGVYSDAGTHWELKGQMDMRFVGPQAEHAMGSYGLKGTTTTSPIGISGTFVLEKGPVDPL